MGENTKSQTPGKKPKSSKTPVILLALAVAGAGLWLTTHRKTAQGKTTEGDTQPQSVTSVLPLESFVVNLSDPDQSAFLRIGIDLGLDQPLSKGKADEKGSPLTPKIRDIILSTLTTWQSADLIAPDGKTKLKEQLLKALHERAPEVPVQEVYFTEFLVQR